MKNTAALLGLTMVLTASASAWAGAAPTGVRPAAVFGELVTAPPATEQPRIAAMLGQFGAKGGVPAVDVIMSGLGKMVGAATLEGLDTKRPIALVVLDPRTFQKPLLLVAEVAADKALTTSLSGSPDVASKRQKRLVVLGAKDAVDAGADYAFGRLKTGPADGVRVRVFVEPVWAAFGAQAQAMKTLMMAQGGQPGSPVPAATMGKMFDGLVAGIEQSHELDVEVGARAGGLDFVMTLQVKPGTTMDKFAAQQSPADFSLVSKFADQPYSLVAGGRVNMSGAGEGLMELLLGGPNKDPKLASQMADWIRLASGELAMMGQVMSPSKVEYQYLLRSPEAQKLASVFPAMIDAMNQGGMFEGMAKIARTPKANASYDGLTLAQSELHYDFSKMTTIPEKDRKFTLQSVWTSWEDVVAMSTGGNAGDRMKKLIDSARHGKGTWQPNATIRAAIERARAAKESMWMRMDLSAMSATAPKPVAMPPGIAPNVGIGASPHTLWMRISVPAPPQTAGSL